MRLKLKSIIIRTIHSTVVERIGYTASIFNLLRDNKWIHNHMVVLYCYGIELYWCGIELYDYGTELYSYGIALRG